MHQHPRISCSIYATTYTQWLTQKADDSPSHPSSFPPTASTCPPILHLSDHHPHIPSHVSMTARTQGMAERSSSSQHRALALTINFNPNASPCYIPITRRAADRPSPTSNIALAIVFHLHSHPNSYHLHTPCRFTAITCANEWPIGPLIHSTSRPGDHPHSDPSDYHPHIPHHVAPNTCTQPNEQPTGPLVHSTSLLSNCLRSHRSDCHPHTLSYRSEYLHPTSGQQALSPFSASRPDCLHHIPTYSYMPPLTNYHRDPSDRLHSHPSNYRPHIPCHIAVNICTNEQLRPFCPFDVTPQ
jgi:hypothetical protein